jgi:hypothetical protein
MREPVHRQEKGAMSEEPKKNEEVFQRLIEEGYNRGDLDVLNEIFAVDFVEHQAGIVPPTADGVKGSIEFLRAAGVGTLQLCQQFSI